MNLELTENEKEVLVLVLDSFMTELRGEIASGLTHNIKAKLKNEEALLKSIQDKVNAMK
ncbi:MAG TPA: hypothetical protein VLD40_07550 [Dissulfurispiraceae bacterium]|nr:hypothetical protein [Dissulfurispiraceae bacterium]